MMLLAAVAALDLLFVCAVMYRRIARGIYFREKDQARQRLRPIIDTFLRYEAAQDEVVEGLRWVRTKAARDALREMLLEQMQPETADRITTLFFQLGSVGGWARIAFGGRAEGVMISALTFGRLPCAERKPSRIGDALRRTQASYVARVLAVDALGRLAPDFAEVFALAAVDDPAGEVRRVALAALGRHRCPSGIPHVLGELRRALGGRAHLHPRDVSARSAKAALVSYGVEHLRWMSESLGDRDPEFRLYVVDSMREICARESRQRPLQRQDFPDELYTTFLMRLVRDESADVRARSAPVVAQFHDMQASQALRRLLQDENEFVRLHAVRAAADAAYPELLPALAERTTDARWRVREAAVKALARLGTQAEELLFRRFACSTDRYESEQMTEEMQRTGLVERVLSDLAGRGEELRLALAVCRRMVAIGRTALLEDELLSGSGESKRLLLLEAFASVATPQAAAIVERAAAGEWSRVRERAVVLLGEMRGKPTAVGVA